MRVNRFGFGTYWFLSSGIALMSALIVVAAIGTSFPEAMPHVAHYVDGLPLALYAHIIFGPLALALAPFQFMQRIRAKHPKIHKLLGYSYLGSILIAGVSALALLFQFQGSLWAGIGFLILALGWMGSTGYAVLLAVKKDIVAHRKWVRRSAVFTFAAVTLRLIMAPLMMTGMPLIETYNYTAWLSWLLPMIVVELWVIRKRNNRPDKRALA